MTELDKAKAIVAEIAPGRNPELTCMLVAAAIAGLRGLGMRHIRVGALFWPDKFVDEPYLSMRGGWGCEGYSNGRLHLAGDDVDEEVGSFAGHTWIEPEPETVVDLMHEHEGEGRDIYTADFTLAGRYIPRRTLEQRVKKHWRAEMLRAIKLGREGRS